MNIIKQMTLALLLLSLSIIPFRGFSADHLVMSLQNATSTTNTIEFDVTIMNDGTSAVNLGGYQFGINFNSAILNGGTPAGSSYTYIAGTRDPIFSGLTGVSVLYNNNQLKAVSTTVPSVNAVPLVIGVAYTLGRFRFTNTVNWLAGSVPNLQFQLVSATGKTQIVAIGFINGSNLSTAMNSPSGTLGGFSNVGGLTLNVPLPVTISSFYGMKAGNEDILTWNTSQEINNRHFNLQYSTDGMSFRTIARIDSKAEQGNSASALNYSCTYATPGSGHNYYRLEQVDIDGRTTIATHILDLERSGKQVEVNLFPNPATNVLHVNITAEKPQNTVVKILDMNGRTVKMVKTFMSQGSQTITIDINNLSIGSYFIQIYENNSLSFTDKIKKVD